MEEKNYEFDAKQARQWADNPLIVMKRVYKMISEAAHEGSTEFTYEFENASPAAINIICKSLFDKGFTLSLYTTDEELNFPLTGTYRDGTTYLTISW